MTLSLRKRAKRLAAERAKTEAEKAIADADAAEKAAWAKEEEHEKANPAVLEPTAEELRQLVSERVTRDPATAALILREWLGASAVTDTDTKPQEAAAPMQQKNAA